MLGVIIKSFALAVILSGLLRTLGLKEYAKAVVLSCFLTGITAFVLWINPYIISIKNTAHEMREDFKQFNETLDKGSQALDKINGIGKPIGKIDRAIENGLDKNKFIDDVEKKAVDKTKIPILDKLEKYTDGLYKKLEGE